MAAAAAALLCAGGLAGRAHAAGAHPGVDLQQQLAQNIPESAEIAESALPAPPPGPARPAVAGGFLASVAITPSATLSLHASRPAPPVPRSPSPPPGRFPLASGFG